MTEITRLIGLIPALLKNSGQFLQSLRSNLHCDVLQLIEYILNIVEATRTSRDLALGSSPRGGLATLALARAWALIKGRSYVVPDDIRELAPYTLRHRLILSAEAHARGKTASGVFDSILSGVHIPLGPTR